MWDESNNQVEMILIRHGITAENKEKRYIGRTDSGLCEEGKNTLEEYVRSNCYPDVEQVYASPMKRCLESCDIIFPDKSIHIMREFKEMDFGDFEGKNYMELQKDPTYQKWINSNGTIPFPNGDSRECFLKRTQCGYLRMFETLGQNIRRIGLVVHGGTIMAILCSFYGGEYYDYHILNGQGYRCICNRKDGKILQVERIM